jgi:ABC-type Na+ efflux pump permease subunit
MKWVGRRKISRMVTKGESRISQDSILYGKAVPAILIGMLVMMVALIFIAVGFLLGVLPL